MGGESERFAKGMLASRQMELRLRKEIPAAWHRLLSGPNDILIELLQEEVQDALGVRPSESLTRRELQAIVAGRSSTVQVMSTADPEAHQKDAAPPPSTRSGPSRKAKRAATNVLEIRLWSEAHRIGPAYEVLTTIAEMVYARHRSDFHRVLQLAKYYTTPSECRAPYLIGDSGIYLDHHMSYQEIRRGSMRLLEHFGHDADELDIVLND